MFKHILLGWIHQYRNIETGGEEAAAGDAPVEQSAEIADDTQEHQQPEQHNDGWPEGTPEWMKRRMSEQSRKRREAEQKAADLERRMQELEARQANATPDQIANMDQNQLQEYVEALANQRAQQIAQQNQAQSARQQRWQKIEADGAAHGEELANSVNRLREAGATGQNFIEALEEIDEAADVLVYLGQHQNLEEAARIASLPPVKMAIELAKLGPKARNELKKGKQVTKAPPPANPLGGNAGSPGAGKEPALNSPEWFAWRQEQVAKRRGR